jgi:hypothetical protein
MSLAKNEESRILRRVPARSRMTGRQSYSRCATEWRPPDRHRTSSEVSDLSSARQAGVIPDISRSNKIDGRLVSIFDGP